MKINTPKLILILSLISTLLFNSCTKVTQTNSNSSSTTDVFTYKVDGVAKKATVVIAAIYTTQNTIQISGSTGLENVGLMVNAIKTGTYDVVADGLILSYGTDSTYQNTALGLTGTLTITTLTSTTIAGTFSFTGPTPGPNSITRVVTEGKFSCSKITKI